MHRDRCKRQKCSSPSTLESSVMMQALSPLALQQRSHASSSQELLNVFLFLHLPDQSNEACAIPISSVFVRSIQREAKNSRTKPPGHGSYLPSTFLVAITTRSSSGRVTCNCGNRLSFSSASNQSSMSLSNTVPEYRKFAASASARITVFVE